MGLLENIQTNLNDIAGKVGLTPEKVKQLGDTLHAKLEEGGHQLTALQETARQHGVSVEKVEEFFKHATGPGGVGDQLNTAVKDLFKKK